MIITSIFYFRGGPVYMSALGALEMALWDIKGKALAYVRRRSRVLIAAGELLYSRWDYIPFFESRCADFAQPDVTHVGGMLELKCPRSISTR